MLVLGRREGETFYIGSDIVVTILRTRQGTVRIGVEAPKNIPILREELIKKSKEKTKQGF